MADTKLSALPVATVLVASDLLYGIQDVGGTPDSAAIPLPVLQAAANLIHTAGPADAAQTMAVGAMYVVDISGYTADRTYTLPAVAAVGDRCGILLSAGDTVFELLVTAAAGDTLNGIAGGTEWSRLFIAYEVVILRCIVANAAWVVEYDGRIPQQGLMRLSTSADGETAATFVSATAFSGVWIADIDVGNITTVATDRMTIRRAGNFSITCNYRSKDNIADGNYAGAQVAKNGTTTLVQVNRHGSAAAVIIGSADTLTPLAVNDYVLYQYRTQLGSLGALGQAAPVLETSFSLVEVL